jgi:hypothetical protein
MLQDAHPEPFFNQRGSTVKVLPDKQGPKCHGKTGPDQADPVLHYPKKNPRRGRPMTTMITIGNCRAHLFISK